MFEQPSADGNGHSHLARVQYLISPSRVIAADLFSHRNVQQGQHGSVAEVRGGHFRRRWYGDDAPAKIVPRVTAADAHGTHACSRSLRAAVLC